MKINYFQCMSREKNLNKILQFLYDNDSYQKEAAIVIGTNIDASQIIHELRFIEMGGYIHITTSTYNAGDCRITEKGKYFYKWGGYVWEKIKKRIFQVSSVIAFIIICWTFAIEFRGCEPLNKIKAILPQASATLK